jgi:hypothetical protein
MNDDAQKQRIPVKNEAGEVIGETTEVRHESDGIRVTARIDDPATRKLLGGTELHGRMPSPLYLD